MRISDKTVVQNLGWCGFGAGANFAHVDVLDGKIARIRPVNFNENYTPEDLNEWQFHAKGKTFRPGFKTLIPPLSYAYKHRAYSPNRVPYPLKRVDWDPNGERNPQTRGISGYERISWDEAGDIIAAELVRIHDTYGNRAILVQGEGHGETKVIHTTHGCQAIMLDHIAPEPGQYTIQARQPDSWEGWYWGAKHVWGCESHGQQNPQDMLIKDVTENSDAVLFWGADPETTPWGWGGLQPSRICFWFTDIGIKQIHIAPDVNYTNAVHSDRWIPILPNTDAAFQLAIAYVWMTEGLYDKDYIDTHTDGFDWFEYYVLGDEDGIPKTPQWAAEKCGIPSYRIKAFARWWAERAVSIAHCNGGGYIRSCFSHEPARLEVYLLAMQGLGKPGCNQFKWIEWGIQNIHPVPPSDIVPTLSAGYHGWRMMPPPKHFLPKTLTPDAILNQEKSITWSGHVVCSMPKEDQFEQFEFPGDGPRIHMIWSDTPCWETCWNGGNSYQDAMRHESIEFYLVQHPWMENDTLLADIILPISTVFECSDLGSDVYNGQWAMIALEEQAIEPVCESMSDYEAVCFIAKKLEEYGGIYEGLHDKYTQGRSIDDDIKYTYEHAEVPLDEYPFEKLNEQKYFLFPTKPGWEDIPPGFKNFHDDPEAFPLKTPTGKLEIYSTNLAVNFPDDKVRGPVAHWIEEGDGHEERISSKRAEQYPHLLMSNHPRWRVHAEHDDLPWLREIKTCKVFVDGYGYEPIWIHPSDAERYGLKNGDVAELFNERGSVLGGIYITERIMPTVLYQDHGARCDTLKYGVGGLDRGGANNLICPTATTSKNAAGEVTNGFLVGIRKADLDALAKEYPEAFARDYDPAYGYIADTHIVKDDAE